MSRIGRYIAIAVLALGVAGVAMGTAFIVEGQSKANFIKESMRAEQVSLQSLGVEGATAGDLIDSAAEAQKAADTIREHRLTTYGTYKDVTGGGRYDPTNLDQLKYTQALNLENYLYLGVASLGLTTVTIVSGIFMVVTGIALGGTGLVLFLLAKSKAATA
jgi:hypothetical protein